MAIANLPDLVAAIASWLERNGDTVVTDNADTFVSLAEARLNRDLLGPGDGTKDASLTGTTNSALLTLPADYLAPVALHLTTFGDPELLLATVAGVADRSVSPGIPSSWAYNAGKIQLDCPCDQAHTFLLRYRTRFALSDIQPTNWLLTSHPDVYLYASIIEAATFLQDADMVSGYEQLIAPRIAAVQLLGARAVQIAPLTVDPGF